MTRRNTYLVAKDRLRARVTGPITEEKLAYVAKYSQAFMSAMAPKRDEGRWSKLVYIDLLSGPGLCINGESREEYSGSVLRALAIDPPFDHLYCCDSVNANIAALKKRIPQKDQSRVTCEIGDCNLVVKKVLATIQRNTLGLAFVDPEGLQVHFKTFELLASKPIDVLYLFPGFGIIRNYRRLLSGAENIMDKFWGDGWRQLPEAKLASGKKLTPEEIERRDPQWVRSYRQKLKRIGYVFQDEDDPVFLNEKESVLYHLLFFSKHQAGLTIWHNIKQIEPSGQRKLRF